MGRIGAPHGLRGWSQVWSYTDPPQGLLGYASLVGTRGGKTRSFSIAEGRMQGERAMLRFTGVDDRDAAAALTGYDLSVERAALAPTPPGSYYWHDLLGLAVVTVNGIALGRVQQLIQTGVHDVLVVQGERERLIPFALPQVVKKVDIDAGYIEVDWDAEY
ncbi:MAG: ribosome maturation factor RimM [Immundisolibacter sp.]|uniref:ribosome maturation factor RimM n=1 Tax=Immundisolibacter sp. TaxID=1934948 RepID=UPI003EDF9E22